MRVTPGVTALAPTWAGDHPQRLNMSVSLKNVLDPSVKLINVPESQPLSTHLLNILCDDGGVHLGWSLE